MKNALTVEMLLNVMNEEKWFYLVNDEKESDNELYTSMGYMTYKDFKLYKDMKVTEIEDSYDLRIHCKP